MNISHICSWFVITDKIYQRQLKESHRADVPPSTVDSVCSQITQIGQLNNQVWSKHQWMEWWKWVVLYAEYATYVIYSYNDCNHL